MRSPTKSVTKRVRDAESELNLPPGFRFHPTDEELIVHYLFRKSQSTAKIAPPPSIIADVDLYKHDPWDLPDLALFGTKEWYFFTPRDRKYPNGSRPNRVTGKLPELINRSSKNPTRKKPLGSRKPWCFTREKGLKESRQIGSCMSIDFPCQSQTLPLLKTPIPPFLRMIGLCVVSTTRRIIRKRRLYHKIITIFII